jgi:hypothetical protein
MTKFQKLYESLLLEMPHISFEVGGKLYDFDFELEKYQRDWYALVRLMHNILGSNVVKDKYGNVLKLNTREQKERLVEELRGNPYFNAFLKKFYNKSFDELLDLSHHNPKLNIAHKNNTTPMPTNYGKNVSSSQGGSSMGSELPSGNSLGV